jgi:CubicO group peptidase (beta-lactamase class C family)
MKCPGCPAPFHFIVLRLRCPTISIVNNMFHTAWLLTLATTCTATAGTALSTPSPLGKTLQENLNTVVTAESTKYKCAIGASIYSKSRGISLSAAEGTTSFQKNAPKSTPEDIYPWGSITKPSTGTAILRLVQAGTISLNDSISTYIDPMFAQMKKDYPATVNFSTAQDVWGPQVQDVTIYHLATMNSGIPDFDTAKPYPPPPLDSLRKSIYNNPTHDYAPHELISFPWVYTGKLVFTPGTERFAYSSTNFVLLGLILAHLDGQVRWTDFDQSKFLPSSILNELKSVVYYTTGAPINRTSVVGYDRTSYNGHSSTAFPGIDVSAIHGVFAGWTASDYTSTTIDAATLAYHIYSTQTQELLSVAHQELMIPTNGIYGFATFDLSFENGYSKTKYGKSYGHIGATYGYDSMLAYYPALDVTIAIGTNMENDDQTHPSDTLCILYGAVYNQLTNSTDVCTYKMQGYFGGECKCK